MIQATQATTKDVECTCRRCGESFTVKRVLGPNGRIVGGKSQVPWYCSNMCRNDVPKTVVSQCAHCDSDMTIDNSRPGTKRKYCGEECKRAADEITKAVRQQAASRKLICETCGGPIAGHRKRWCDRCRDETGAVLHKHSCPVCGEEFKGRAGRKYCSPVCQRDARVRRRVKREKEGIAGARSMMWAVSPAMAPKWVGLTAEAMFDVLAAKRCWQVAEVRGDNVADIDRLVHTGDGWQTVQIKAYTTYTDTNKSRKRVQIKKSSGGFYKDDAFDLLAIIDISTGDAWLIPWGHDVNMKWWTPKEEWDRHETHILATADAPREGEIGSRCPPK